MFHGVNWGQARRQRKKMSTHMRVIVHHRAKKIKNKKKRAEVTEQVNQIKVR